MDCELSAHAKVGIPITTPSFWHSREECTDDRLRHVFRSTTDEPIPLFDERTKLLRDAGAVLARDFQGSITNCIAQAEHSAAALVNLLVDRFPSCFKDESTFEGKRVRFYKRAQILVADLWACFNGESYGAFDDINEITMFADYRIPQMLRSLGCLMYSPPLESRIKRLEEIRSGETVELEIRGCSIWCVELIRRQIVRWNPTAQVNSALIDFFLYDTCKEREERGKMQQCCHIIGRGQSGIRKILQGGARGT